jgi:hypothetical protein
VTCVLARCAGCGPRDLMGLAINRSAALVEGLGGPALMVLNPPPRLARERLCTPATGQDVSHELIVSALDSIRVATRG